LLVRAATASANELLKKAVAEFTGLSPGLRKELVNCIAATICTNVRRAFRRLR